MSQDIGKKLFTSIKGYMMRDIEVLKCVRSMKMTVYTGVDMWTFQYWFLGNFFVDPAEKFMLDNPTCLLLPI